MYIAYITPASLPVPPGTAQHLPTYLPYIPGTFFNEQKKQKKKQATVPQPINTKHKVLLQHSTAKQSKSTQKGEKKKKKKRGRKKKKRKRKSKKKKEKEGTTDTQTHRIQRRRPFSCHQNMYADYPIRFFFPSSSYY